MLNILYQPNWENNLKKTHVYLDTCIFVTELLCCTPESNTTLVNQLLLWVLSCAISYSRDLPDPETELVSLVSSAVAGEFFTTIPPGKPNNYTPI